MCVCVSPLRRSRESEDVERQKNVGVSLVPYGSFVSFQEREEFFGVDSPVLFVK